MATREEQREQFVERLNYDKHKLSSKNFDRLMKQRGLSDEEIKSLKASMVNKGGFEVRHARKGEEYVMTHSQKYASGVFVSEQSLGKTPEERAKNGALPPSNDAKYETKVALSRDQNLIYGKIAPQPGFEKQDPRNIPRSGGKEQIITDGGFYKDAIHTHDPKHPVPSKGTSLQPSHSSSQGSSKSQGSSHSSSHSASHSRSK